MKLTTTIFALFLIQINAKSTNLLPSTRIIGGTDARAGEYKFAAAITVRTQTSQLFCAGTLISDQWVLTAAQCINNAVQATIKLGSTSLNDKDDNRVTVSSSLFHIHPSYDPLMLKNDVGLVQFHQPISFTAYVSPIEFIATFRLQDSATATAIGWGQTSDQVGADSDKLQEVELVALSTEECQAVYGNYIVPEMVCVAGNSNEGTCIGDIGGPLVQHVGRGYYIHQGIASFLSAKGCESNEPSGFTRTYSYVEWINETTGLKYF